MKSLQVTSWPYALVYCIQDNFDIPLLTSSLFWVVAIYSSREFRRKKKQPGSRVARVTRSCLMGIEKAVYMWRYELQKSECDKDLVVAPSSLRFSCYLLFIICEIKTRWKQQVTEGCVLCDLVVLTNPVLSHWLASPVQPWPVCHGVIM